MRRLNSYDSKISTVQNDNTLRGLFNAIDSYREKKADTEGAVAQIDRILGNVPELVNASDPTFENGSSPLIYACRARHHPTMVGVRLRSGPSFEVVNLLLHYGANPNARNNDNRTALHYACRNEPKSNSTIFQLDEKKNMLKVVKKLIKAGGDLRLHDKDGLMPIDHTTRLDARSKYRQEMLAFLTKQQESFSAFQHTRGKDDLGTPHRVKLSERKSKPSRGIFGKTPGYDFNLEQPRIKQTGFGVVIDHVGGTISAFGEAAAIPFADWDQLIDPREQLLRFRCLKFTISRKIWRSSAVSVMALENIAKEDDKHYRTENYKVDRNDIFTMEITKSASLRHKNIMMIMAICHDPTSFLVRGLVYERVQLGSLKYQLDIRKNGTLSAEEWIPLMLQIVDATMFLHESGIIHQVICPESIMLCDHRTAKLGMLAFSRLSHDASRNWEATRIPDKLHRYVAPEILQMLTGEGSGQPRESSDVYSICATLFHLLTGEEPFAETIDSKVKHGKGEIAFGPDDYYSDTKVAEVLTWPLRSGMKRVARERKTHLKDLHYHLDNMMRVMIEAESELNLTMCGSAQSATMRSAGSGPGMLTRQTQSEILPSPYSTRSSLFRRSCSIRSDAQIVGPPTKQPLLHHQLRSARVPLGLPKKCASLREFNQMVDQGAAKRGSNQFLDMNENRKLSEFEYQEPLYLSHEQADSDGTIENESLHDENPLKQAASRESYMKRYIDEQFEQSGIVDEEAEMADSMANNEDTPVRARPASRRSLVASQSAAIAESVNSIPVSHASLKKAQSLGEANADLAEARAKVNKQNNIISEMELQMNSLFSDSFDDAANITPHNLAAEPPKPLRESTNSLRLLKPDQRPATAPSKVANFVKPQKNVTINSDCNVEHEITPNDTMYKTAESEQNEMMGDYDVNQMKSMMPHPPPPQPTKPAIVQRAEIVDQIHLTRASLKMIPTEDAAVIEEKRHEMPEFKNHVDVAEPNTVAADRDTPDYLEPELIHQKERMRDTRQIPRIDVTSPSPDLPELKPAASEHRRLPTPDFFPPPPNPAETAKMSLKPVLKKQSNVNEKTVVQKQQHNVDMDTTRTPSRLTFGEKLDKFRAISIDEPKPAGTQGKTQLAEEEQELPLAPPPQGMVTSTPFVGRGLEKKQSNTVITAERMVTENIRMATEDIKRMLDTSTDKHFTKKQQPNDQQQILANCAAHQTFSESINFKDIDFDTADEEEEESILSDATNSEEVQNPNNISLWEEGMDEEPIVGNEIVHTSIRLPPLNDEDEEEEIVEQKIVPSFDFDKTHHVSEMDHYNDEDTPVVNRCRPSKDQYRLMPSLGLTPRRDSDNTPTPPPE